jgi:hypothetical protein
LRVAPHVQFFILLAYFPTGFVVAWHAWQIPFIPQPGRYELEMDLTLLLAIAFAAAAVLERAPRAVRVIAANVVLAGLAIQAANAGVYAWNLIRADKLSQMSEYKVAQWLDRNRHGERAFVSGSASYLYNVFTDNPQLYGGHDQHTVNNFIPIVGYTIYSGMNAGGRDAEYSIFWLKAFGTHSIYVPGPASADSIHPFVHPRKFEGLLPLAWREDDDSIYDVPMRSTSLAHVIPASAVVARRPIHGLDIAPVEPYVAALDDPGYPLATFQWQGMSDADIHADVSPGQVISVQVTYERGWEAWANGRPQKIRADGIGQMIIDTDCIGPCEISLLYTGGWEHIATRMASALAFLVTAAYALRVKSK